MDEYLVEQFTREINSTVKSNALNQLCCAFWCGKSGEWNLQHTLTKWKFKARVYEI